jgi:hypothetical protein
MENRPVKKDNDKKEKTKAVRSRKMRRQGERTSETREKNDGLLYNEKNVR